MPAAEIPVEPVVGLRGTETADEVATRFRCAVLGKADDKVVFDGDGALVEDQRGDGALAVIGSRGSANSDKRRLKEAASKFPGFVDLVALGPRRNRARVQVWHDRARFGMPVRNDRADIYMEAFANSPCPFGSE